MDQSCGIILGYVNRVGDFLDVYLRVCPWCKTTPDIYMPINVGDDGNGTWMWSIMCNGMDCSMKPRTKHVSLRRESRFDINFIESKLVTLAKRWNKGINTEFKDKKVIDLTPLYRLIEKHRIMKSIKPCQKKK